MDLLQGVQDAVQDQRDPEDIDAMAGSGDFKMPSLEQLLDMIGGSNMTEEERKDLMDSILKSQPTRANRGGAEMSLYDQFVFLMIPVAVLVLIFGKAPVWLTINRLLIGRITLSIFS